MQRLEVANSIVIVRTCFSLQSPIISLNTERPINLSTGLGAGLLLGRKITLDHRAEIVKNR